MRRVVIYAGTRNLYHNMCTAAKSLLMWTRVDRVWFLIEDDEFPEPLPDIIRCKNVAGQKWFDPDGPNFHNTWTYMTLIRLALPEIFDESRVLWLDVDTIVLADIGPMMDMAMDGKSLAMVSEPEKSKGVLRYYNAGVTLMDLDKLRQTGRYKDMIRIVNSQYYTFPDQDVINVCMQDDILEMAPVWNSCEWTGQPLNAAIIHYAANRKYYLMPLFAVHEKVDWSEIKCR